MPAKSRIPSYRRHATGLGFVHLNGRHIYLGKHGTEESRREYDRVISEWMARGRRPVVDSSDLTIVELIAAFWEHALIHYHRLDGTHTSELHCYNLALAPLKNLYGERLLR